MFRPASARWILCFALSFVLASSFPLDGARGAGHGPGVEPLPSPVRSSPAGGFVENAGQIANSAVRYAYDGGRVRVGFAAGQVLYVLRPSEPSNASVLVRWTFPGARPVQPIGAAPLPYRSNFLQGTKPAEWHTGVPSYAEVRYANLYAGIDLVFHATPQGVKYDLLVHPGSDPGRIVNLYEGARAIEVDRDGSLIIHTLAGDLRDTAPVAVQEGRSASCAFELLSPTSVGLRCSGRDASREFRIDPLLYASYLGGSETDSAQSIAVDANGNAYVTGIAGSADFPTTPGAFNRTFMGGCWATIGCGDAYVFKLNATGTVLYATFLGGSGYDKAYSIAVDDLGYAYVTGNTSSADFPTTPGAYDRSLAGTSDAFVTKLSPTGDSLAYSTYVGGRGFELASGVAVGAAHNAFVTGRTDSTDFPTSVGAYNRTYTTPAAFVAKLSTDGASLAYSTFVGSTASGGNAIALDAGGNAYITGNTPYSWYPTTPGAYSRPFRLYDAFVTKLNAAGSALVYSTFLGGTRWDFGYAITVDAGGEAFVAGNTNSTDFPTTPGAFNTTQTFLGKGGIGFVTKFNAAGNGLVYSTFLGGTSNIAYGIAVDAFGAAFTTGMTWAGFPVTPGALQPVLHGTDDAFVAEFNPAGSAYLAATYLGGLGNDAGYGIAIGPSGNLYVAGQTDSTDFPAYGSSYPYAGGFSDGFAAAFTSLSGTLLYRTTLDTSPSGLDVLVNGTAMSTPVIFDCGAGDILTLEAPSPQLVNSSSYAFESWSDGGAQQHNVACDGPRSYTATFAPSTTPDFVLIVNPADALTSEGGYVNFYVTVIGVNGYTGPAVDVSLLSPDPRIAGQCIPQSMVVPTGSCRMAVSVGIGVHDGTYTLRFEGSNGSVNRTATALLYVSTPVPSNAFFRLDASPVNLTIPAGDEASTTLWLNWTGMPRGTVDFYASTPSGFAASFSRLHLDGNGSLTTTLVVASSVLPGTYSVVVYADFAPIGMRQEVAFRVTVAPSVLRPLLTDALAWVITGTSVFVAVMFAALYLLRRRREPQEPFQEPKQPPG